MTRASHSAPCGQLRFVAAGPDDPVAQPLFTELAVEYAQRYGGGPQRYMDWMRDGPAEEFAPPDGGMLIGLLDSRPVTGGAFCRFDAHTAELKRIWTHRAHRRRGYAAALVGELETQIAARGYRKVYLITGDRQPEAEELYLSLGYTRLPEPLPSRGPVLPVAFEKSLA
ncbi:GNAT family acetyltransferase [Mycobacterium sp. 852002-51163_SCH5372311]|uniref:GNAT family N-acetyltransferase n=1 Tax=Mycobacterium sp. 852002-51163_SCH5372311 TaxID=1834097 RepID=UPI0007FE5A04|nr:GNAT family N-acetyltransferase [Mycobacterium sp. 852002-51163_SCH5372311]OBF92867.1 GNAT family acetyltransferase [Mycobacterium sp. 852002-51163_SCH5372311]